jgi:hypothetical protein
MTTDTQTMAEAHPTRAAGTAPPYVEAIIKYPERAAEGGNISGNKEFTFGLEDHRMRIHNARLVEASLDAEGFALLKRPTDIDLTSREDTEARWHPLACDMVRDLTGARDVFALLGILRGGEEDLGGGPALMAHVDFNGDTLRSWVARLAPPDRADALKGRRLVNINLWTPVRPVENMPLGVCDATSVRPGDFMNVSFGKPETRETDTFAGAIQSGGFVLGFNPDHRWWYYPHMQPDEVLAFRLHDTGDPSMRMTAHTAFEDPTSEPGAPKRMSYELRTIAVLD